MTRLLFSFSRASLARVLAFDSKIMCICDYFSAVEASASGKVAVSTLLGVSIVLRDGGLADIPGCPRMLACHLHGID